MIFASSCPSCLFQALQKACGMLRTASSSAFVWAIVFVGAARNPRQKIIGSRFISLILLFHGLREATRSKHEANSDTEARSRENFSCVEECVRVHSQLPVRSVRRGTKNVPRTASVTGNFRFGRRTSGTNTGISAQLQRKRKNDDEQRTQCAANPVDDCGI